MKPVWTALTLLIILSLGIFSFQKSDPWTAAQLMQPATLAAKLKGAKPTDVVVYNIGPSGSIRHSVEIGATQEAEGMAQLKTRLSALPKTTTVVLYCGCCPFAKCPNIRPAFELTQQMGFTNARLLDIPKNLKADWIDKGYPMAE